MLVAPLLVWMFLAFILNALLRRVLGAVGFYNLVWHRALFDVALYVVVLGGVVALASYWTVL